MNVLNEEIKSGAFVTNKGRTLIGKLLAAKGQLNITKVEVGSGPLPPDISPENMTSLSYYVMNADISSITNPTNGESTLTCQLINIGVVEAFSVTEAGIFASDPDEGEILYCYLPLQDNPEPIPADGGPINKVLTLKINVIVDKVAQINVVFSPDAFVRREELETFKDELKKDYAIKNHASSTTEYGAASTTEYGHTKLYSGIDSDRESLAATPKAVKAGIEEAKLIPIAGNDKKGYFEVGTDGILCVKEA